MLVMASEMMEQEVGVCYSIFMGIFTVLSGSRAAFHLTLYFILAMQLCSADFRYSVKFGV